MLTAFILTLHHGSGWDMCYTDGALRFIDMLAAGSGGPECVDLQILRIDLKIYVIHFGKDCHCSRGSMDPSSGFRYGNPLHTMAAGFKFQSGPCAFSLYDKTDFLDSSKLRKIGVRNFDLPSLCRSIHGVHAVQIMRKQHAFFPSDSAADLHDHILAVIGILGKQQQLKFVLQLVLTAHRMFQFILCQFFHFGIIHEAPGIFNRS